LGAPDRNNRSDEKGALMELTSLERDMPAGTHGAGAAKAFSAKRMAPFTRAGADA
jgi:hypothetical protein